MFSSSSLQNFLTFFINLSCYLIVCVFSALIAVRLPAVIFLLGVGSFVAYRLYSFVCNRNEHRRKSSSKAVVDVSGSKSTEGKDSNTAVISGTPILPGLNWSALADITPATVNATNSECSMESIEILVQRLQAERDLLAIDRNEDVDEQSECDQTPTDNKFNFSLNDSRIFQGGTICKINRLLGQLDKVKQSCAQLDHSLHKAQDQKPPVFPVTDDVETLLIDTEPNFNCSDVSEDSLHLSGFSDLERSNRFHAKQFERDLSFNLSVLQQNLNENRLNSTEQNMAWLMDDDDDEESDSMHLTDKLASLHDKFSGEIKPTRSDRSANNSCLQDKQNQTSDGESEPEDEWPFEAHRHVTTRTREPLSFGPTSIQNEEATLEWDSTDVVLFHQDEPEDCLLNKSVMDSDSLSKFNSSMQSSLASIEQARGDDTSWSALHMSAEEQALLSNLSGRFNHHHCGRTLTASSQCSTSASSSICSQDSNESHERSLQQLVQEAKKQGLVRDLLDRLSQFDDTE